ncbi:hypothetical protein RND81_08G069900 [Saponaria officinalis]|uniref:Uncharacterized protein n=1 Tax=Saponaria officinalis TaxID=3572 RepID=A0AAW1J4H3_SAPOF
MKTVSEFFSKHDIKVPCMNSSYVIPKRERRGRLEMTNLHHFQVEVFLCLIDQILHEFENRFDETSKEFLDVCHALVFEIDLLVLIVRSSFDLLNSILLNFPTRTYCFLNVN